MKKNIIVLSAIVLFACICSAESSGLVGKLYVVGNVPFTRLICETDAQEKYILNGGFLDELKNLQGTVVNIEGELSEKTSEYGLPVFKVEKYRLLFVGSEKNRKEPVVGFVRVRGDSPYLDLSPGKSYSLQGPLARKIARFTGAKVWIVGKIKPPAWIFGKAALVPEAFHVIKRLDNENNKDGKISEVN